MSTEQMEEHVSMVLECFRKLNENKEHTIMCYCGGLYDERKKSQSQQEMAALVACLDSKLAISSSQKIDKGKEKLI
jgi:hypothetical protein